MERKKATNSIQNRKQTKETLEPSRPRTFLAFHVNLSKLARQAKIILDRGG